jgi:hypothetical protein
MKEIDLLQSTLRVRSEERTTLKNRYFWTESINFVFIKTLYQKEN